MPKWFLEAKKADFKRIAEAFAIDQVTARIITNRNVTGDRAIQLYLNGTLDDLYSPYLLKDAEKAAGIIYGKIKENKKICIIGDYDIDGVCAAYILGVGLKRCGAIVDKMLPDRVKDGYGINENLIQKAKNNGADTIVTCDNGIAAIEQIAFAKSLGMTVIVTDHHEMPYEEKNGERVYLYSKADAVVNPRQPECSYPFKGLCGAAVAYKLLELLYEMMEIQRANLEELIEFAAFATIGDVMELQEENRILVKVGLDRMRRTSNYGLRALIAVNQIDASKLTAYHIGFILGPCINATGRLDSAERALKLLETEEEGEAAIIAGDLKALNDSRKNMTAEYLKEAVLQIETGELKSDKVLVVYLPDCHESLAGIIAGRIREKYYKPVFILTKADDGVKGSGRSIEAFHMFEELTRCRELFTVYGGHKLAAGLSMPEKNVGLLRETLNSNTTLAEEDFIEKIYIDVPMPFAYVTESLIREFQKLEPFGMGNTKPVFAQKNILLRSARILGKNNNVVKYIVSDEQGRQAEAIWFGDAEKFRNEIKERFGDDLKEKLFRGNGSEITMSIIYYPAINEYMGKKSIQLNIQQYDLE